ncbi:uncharacterized protein LOC129780444 [Toxorhynchites rutilus septentrionalis]|uniref:uncharacterized protein LOC129780444 n=1 Tax=Toxorhynchites rutilus septentrionalis TaxID=329112 RepID=UPI00247AA092|nr:uncharacterized protein LOC129780444 [Toxorhynchites rutilus septentrionalis]
MYSLGGNEPPRKCNRGRLDRLKTVGTFDITNEISRLSQKTMNLNERIIGNRLFTQTVDEATTSAIGTAAGGIGAGLVPLIATAAFGPVTSAAIDTTEKQQQPQLPIAKPSNGPTLFKQNTEIIHLSPHQHVSSNHPLQLKAAKSRSLSTGSYITKESSVHASVEKIMVIKSNSNTDLNEGTLKTIDSMPKNKSLEDSNTMKLNQTRSPMRKPILRKSKKIIRTDSEFLKGNIYEKESSLSSSQYTPTHEKRREFAEHRSSNPSSETHKSTDESSKNISMDEIDTVFSDTMELEQMEADYKMHLKNNLQREYKSDSDTLDEVGKKHPDYSTWKNQSFENTFDVYKEKQQENGGSGGSSKGTSMVEALSQKEDERSKSLEVTEKASDNDLKSKRLTDRPTQLELGTFSDESKHPSADGSFGHLFEKNLCRFKKMNKLLKCKRFSTSALYDNKKNKPNFKETVFFDNKSSPVKSSTESGRSPDKSFQSQSKASISSSKSSLFGTKKGNVFTFKGKKFLFSTAGSSAGNGNSKNSPNKSKSNNEISYSRSKSTKGTRKSVKTNSTACLNLETNSVSPLSEAFYNPTGSVRLSAMELYEKFCSQDFSGLYKHEAVRIDHGDGSNGTDLSEYDPNRSMGAVRKYKRRNFKLLRQKSEPKFSFRTDTLYENEDSFEEGCYQSEEQKEDGYEVDDYSQFLYEEQYYEEDIENLSIETMYYRRNLIREDGTLMRGCQYQEDVDEDEEEEEEDEEEVEEEEEEEEDAYEEELEEEDEDEDQNERYERRLDLEAGSLQPPQIDMAASLDSDCDEIYLMPGNESKKLIIHDFLFHHSNNEFDSAGDEYDMPEDKIEVLDRYKNQDTLTIYKICSKESILDSKGDLDNIPLSPSLEPYFLKSDCLTALERTASLELLSNSSGTLNKSTLTDYAFDTVKNVNLDSCSTSRLSLSLKSEIFEETLANAANDDGSGEIRQIKNWNIEDFTLTPEGSFSDETVDELFKTHLLEELESKTPIEEMDLPIPTVETVPIEPTNPTTSEYTIIDLDEEPNLLDPTISDFTNEITKEFDLLFSRAETESRAASYSGSPAYDNDDDCQKETRSAELRLDPLEVQPVLPTELPTRYSMQKLEPINLDAEEIKITRHTEDQLKTQHDSAKVIAVDNKCNKVDKHQKISEADRTTSSTTMTAVSGADRLRKARSQSLGNLKNKTKCFPL